MVSVQEKKKKGIIDFFSAQVHGELVLHSYCGTQSEDEFCLSA